MNVVFSYVPAEWMMMPTLTAPLVELSFGRAHPLLRVRSATRCQCDKSSEVGERLVRLATSVNAAAKATGMLECERSYAPQGKSSWHMETTKAVKILLAVDLGPRMLDSERVSVAAVSRWRARSTSSRSCSSRSC